MCDFRAGDEVVCVAMSAHPEMVGKIYVVEKMVWREDCGVFAVHLISVDTPHCPVYGQRGFQHTRFRKVQRRDLSAWIKTSVGNTDKLDKRQPKKVRA